MLTLINPVERAEQSAVEHDGLFLYYPQRASQAAKLRAFIEVATAILAVDRWWPKKALSIGAGERL
jgi:hypothetical protein